ncbi:MAG: hypothetical protein RL758_2227 [Pseudomonadota bacterium]
MLALNQMFFSALQENQIDSTVRSVRACMQNTKPLTLENFRNEQFEILPRHVSDGRGVLGTDQQFLSAPLMNKGDQSSDCEQDGEDVLPGR